MRVHGRNVTIESDLLTGHTYEVMVSAVDSVGRIQKEEDSPKSVITIRGKTADPEPAAALTATGFLLAIVLEWTNPSDLDFDHVEIWRGTTQYWDSAVKIAESSGISYIDDIGTTNVTRYYWIVAINTSGGRSDAYPDASSGVGATTTGVGAASIDDYAVTATKMYNNTIILDSDVWTNNSPGAGSIAWNAHSIVYGGASYVIAAGSTSDYYVYWNTGDAVYTTGNTHPVLGDGGFMIAVNKNGTHTLVWNSSANMVIGTAFISNLAVTEAKINSLAVTQAKIGLLAVGTAQLANLAVTNAKVSDMSVAKLTAGTIQSKVITLAIAEGTGDCYIGAGKTDFTNAQAGFIIGLDDSDSNKAKLYIGDSTHYLNWTGAALTVQGLIQTAASGQRIVMDNSDNTLRWYDSSNTNVLTLDDNIDANNHPGIELNESGGVVIITTEGAVEKIGHFGCINGGYMEATSNVNPHTFIDLMFATGGAGYYLWCDVSGGTPMFTVSNNGALYIAGSMTLGAGQTVDNIDVGAHAHTGVAGHGIQIAFSSLSATPTTLAGYGITDAAPSSHVGAGGAAHADVVAGGADGFMTGAMATKLAGIEALADVTDAANVAAAGAIMDGDFSSNGFMERTDAGVYGIHSLGVTDSYTVSAGDVFTINDGLIMIITPP